MQKKLVFGSVAVATVVIGASAAVAFSMLSNEAKVGDTEAAAMKPFLIDGARTQYAGKETQLWPGHTASVVITVRNPNEVGVKVTGATFKNIAVANDAPARCADSVEVTPAVTVDGPVVRPDAAAEVLLADVLKLKSDASDKCQLAKFRTVWTITGQNT